MRFQRLFLATFLAVFTAFAGANLLGCGSASSGSPPDHPATGGDGGGGDGGGGGAQATVTVSAVSSTVTAGGDAVTVTARVTTAAGSPAPDGTAVTFAVSPSLHTALTPAAPTTGSGLVTASFQATATGTFNITATALGVTSTRFGVTSLAPTVSLSSQDTVVASQVGSGGAVVTATVTDHLSRPLSGLTADQVTFSTTQGAVTGFGELGQGVYSTTLTSTQTGDARITGEVFGGSDDVTVAVVSDELARLTLTANPSQLEPNGESELTIEGRDRFENHVTQVTVDLATEGLAGVLPASVELSGGPATARLTAGVAEGTASVRASSGGVEVIKSIPIVRDLTGEPVNVVVEVEPAGGRLAIAGVGGAERATITATVTDYNGAPITDQQGNIEFEILSGPGGGEKFVPSDPGASTVYTPANGTLAGVAHATFQSGTKAGTVTIQVRVVKDKNGVPLNEPIVATIPNLLSVSGPPVSVVIGRATYIVDNRDGTYTHDYFALIRDENGNGVPGVSVSFGQFSNITAAGNDGAIQEGSATFTGNFLSSQVQGDDLLAILSGSSQGGFSIAGSSQDGSLSLLAPLRATESGLQFAIGNNIGGDGPVISPKGAPVTDGDGKVLWENVVPVELINAPLVVYAETSGRAVGRARSFANAWIAPTTVTLVEGADNAGAGDVLAFRAAIRDSGYVAMPIPSFPVSIVVDVPTDSVQQDDGDLNGTGLNRLTVYTDEQGEVQFFWTAPIVPTKASYTITISAADGSLQQTIDIE